MLKGIHGVQMGFLFSTRSKSQQETWQQNQNINPTDGEPQARPPRRRWRKRFRRSGRWLLVSLSLLFSLSLIGRDDYQPDEFQDKAIAKLFEGENFDLIGWEVTAIRDKVGAFFSKPSNAYAQDEQAELVKAYLEQAHQIAKLSRALNRLATDNAEASTDTDSKTSNETDEETNTDQSPPERSEQELQAEIDELRAAQAEIRLAVEEVIQRQISEALLAENITMGDRVTPPVLFSFVEPPKKLVVSPRERIETRYAQMIDADISLEQIQKNETSIREEQELIAYVTNIGGLGAFPAMVVDRASLSWILSTVAHEWSHNYLTFFPLGINYGQSNEITIINETVADIVGDEIGLRVAEKYYPDALPTAPAPTPTPAPTVTASETSTVSATIQTTETITASVATTITATTAVEVPEFDFRTEMRKTRQEVDRLLAAQKVDEAEAYMEERRLEFVENGYNLRVLNQAYFAFHGSYGTSAASTSEIGPKLERLRAEAGSLKAFLETVRWITTEAEINALLDQ